jgi:hypothetical protein
VPGHFTAIIGGGSTLKSPVGVGHGVLSTNERRYRIFCFALLACAIVIVAVLLADLGVM